jgi:hypothetical protein
MLTKFLSENLNVRDSSEDMGTDGRIILEYILGTQWELVDWIHLHQDRDQFVEGLLTVGLLVTMIIAFILDVDEGLILKWILRK